MERNPLDAQPFTALFELRGTVARPNGLEIWKQRARGIQAMENCVDVRSEMNDRDAAGFLLGIADSLVGPVNVFRLKIGDVGLRTAEMPTQIVEAAPLRVLFPLNDELMFLPGDGSFVFETDFWPKALGNERPGKPVH